MILAWAAALSVAGVALGELLAPLPLVALVAAVACFLGAWRVKSRRQVLVLAGAFLLGLARAPHPGHLTSSDLAFYNQRSVQIEGVVAAEPDVRDTGANYVVRANGVVLSGSLHRVGGEVQVHTSRATVLEYGDRVSLKGRLLSPSNTARLPWRDILANRGIGSEMRFPRLISLGSTESGPLGWIMTIRRRLESGIDAWLPEPEASLLIAIALGARSASLGDLAPILAATGLIHLAAISGIKVALVAGILYRVGRSSGNRMVALALSLASLLLYVLLTGATASGERSALMWAMVFLAGYLGRGTVALVSLSLVAALLVLHDPRLLGDIGFQMSVVGTLAIVALADTVLLPLRRLPSPLKESLGVTLAAQVGTLPIVIFGFHALSVTGPIANMLVLPLLPALVVLGFVLGAVSVWPTIAAPISALSYGLLHLVILIAERLAGIGGMLALPPLPGLVTAAYYSGLAAVAWLVLRRVNFAPRGTVPHLGRELLVTGAVAASTLTMSLVQAHADSRAHLYWLGAGHSFLVRDGQSVILIDGSPHPFALSQRLGTLLPYTDRDVQVVIVTDPRASNISGLEALLGHYQTDAVLDVGAEYPSTTYARWRADLRARHVRVSALRTGAVVQTESVRIDVLGPDALYPDPRDSIGLLRISIHEYSWILTGAASTRETTEAVFRPVKLRADALVASDRQPSRDFVQAVRPRVELGPGDLPSDKVIELRAQP